MVLGSVALVSIPVDELNEMPIVFEPGRRVLLRDVSFAMLGSKGQIRFDALEPLTAVQALNRARVLYRQQVVEFNRSQFRLDTALGHPALDGVDAAAPQPLAVPVVPVNPAPLSTPAPRSVP